MNTDGVLYEVRTAAWYKIQMNDSRQNVNSKIRYPFTPSKYIYHEKNYSNHDIHLLN
jgi:hypothetical protein